MCESHPSQTFRMRFPCDGPEQGPRSTYAIVDSQEGAPYRVFLKRGHTGLCVQALLEAVGRLVTLLLQESDVPLERIWKTLVGITCSAGGAWGGKSCMDLLAKVLKDCQEAADGE